MEPIKEGLLDDILVSVGQCIQRDGVNVVYSNHAIDVANGKVNPGERELMTRGTYMICVRVKTNPETFDYVTGTFERQRTEKRTSIVLTPERVQTGPITKQVSAINVDKLRSMLGNAGDIIEESGDIRIVRHYRF